MDARRESKKRNVVLTSRRLRKTCSNVIKKSSFVSLLASDQSDSQSQQLQLNTKK